MPVAKRSASQRQPAPQRLQLHTCHRLSCSRHSGAVAIASSFRVCVFCVSVCAREANISRLRDYRCLQVNKVMSTHARTVESVAFLCQQSCDDCETLLFYVCAGNDATRSVTVYFTGSKLNSANINQL